jgi:hypothetical protein
LYPSKKRRLLLRGSFVILSWRALPSSWRIGSRRGFPGLAVCTYGCRREHIERANQEWQPRSIFSSFNRISTKKETAVGASGFRPRPCNSHAASKRVTGGH